MGRLTARWLLVHASGALVLAACSNDGRSTDAGDSLQGTATAASPTAIAADAQAMAPPAMGPPPGHTDLGPGLRCELVEGDTDPCHLCAIEHCCNDSSCFSGPGGGRCFAEWLPMMRECFEEKAPARTTTPSLDVYDECLCELYREPSAEPCDTSLATEAVRGYDSAVGHFIACLAWPLSWGPDGPLGHHEDAGSDDDGAPGEPRCAEVCFPSWR